MAHSPDDETLATWLSRREKADGFLLLWGEPGAEAWNRRCIRQADLVLVWEPADSQIDRCTWANYLQGDSRSLAPRIDFVVTHRDELPPQRSASCGISDAPLARCHHVQLESPADFARLARAMVNRSVGIVLSGGGAKGFAHVDRAEIRPRAASRKSLQAKASSAKQ